jgi:hypothetical protein
MTTQPDPLDIFTGAKGTTVDPGTVATQIENLLHIVSGRPLPDATTPQALLQSGTQTADAATSPTSLGSADHANPVEGGNAPINQPFHEGHAGVDIGVPVGSHMIAAISGTVTRAVDEPGGYGNLIEITGANGLSVRYGHLSQMGVQAGDTVTAGQSIGVSGGAKGAAGAGNSTGPHLHFEVRQNGQPVDPAAFLAGGASIVGAAPATSAGTTGTAQPTPLSPEAILAAQVQNTTDILSGKDPTQETTTSTTSTQSGTATATGSWAQDILSGIGAPVTPENIKMMETWMAHEGGAIHNNPLNTTQEAPGATNWNSIGVKTYNSYEQGLAATLQTLNNGMYGAILEAFRRGDPAAARSAIVSSPWGTKNL